MTKILDSLSYNGQIQKIVELSNGYIINGQYYNKSNLAPKALKFYKTYGDTKDLAMNKRLSLKTSSWVPTYKSDTPSIIVDSFDPQVTYVYTTGTRSHNINFFKFREVDGNVQVIMDITYSNIPAPGAFFQAYAGQDQYYLYYIMQTNTTSGTGHFVRINKKTLVLESILSFSQYNPTGARVLKETDTFIFLASQRSFSAIYFHRYNKQTNAMETIATPIKNGKGYYGSLMSDLQVTGTNTGYAYTVHQEPTTGSMFINRYGFDFSKSVANETLVSNEVQTVTWNGFPNLPQLTQQISSVYESFIVNANDGKKILVVALYETSTNTPVDASIQGFYSFEIVPTGGLISLGFTQISSANLKGFLYSNNKKVLVAATDAAIYFLNFDESVKKYVVADQIDALPLHIGMDQNENIWYTNSLEEVEMVSLSVPTVVDVKFEKSGYKYEGLDVPTYIEIDAKNYQGSRVGVKLELSIRGDAIFESNSQKVIQEMTDLTGPKRVNVIVKGSGSITIYPKLIV